jgi:hypothetical protein
MAKRTLKEMIFGSSFSTGVRNTFNSLSRQFYTTPSQPLLRDTQVDYEAVRGYYYNTNQTVTNGSFFSRGIVDGCSDFIDLPLLTVKDEELDALLNKCVQDYWKKSIIDMYRISMRDSRCWARLRKPVPGPLTAAVTEDYLELEIITADRVDPYYDPVTNELLRIEISNKVWIEDEPFTLDSISARSNTLGRFHEIIEVITPELYQYWDLTINEAVEGTPVNNTWGFIPLVEIFNEYDPTLNGGISELEPIIPFIQAYHDIIMQVRKAHKSHATPKVKFKVDDVMTFLANNYPDSFNDGQFNGKVNWEGNEILFMETAEDAQFLEVKSSVIGDSVTLLNFIIDCISIASRTPKWVLMKFVGQEVSAQSTSENLPFENKIRSKRFNYEMPFQKLSAMALKIYNDTPIRPSISWPHIQLADLAAEAQAMNQIITATEVANRSGVISRETYRDKLRPFYPTMKNNNDENQQVDLELKADQKNEVAHTTALAKATASATPTPTNGKVPNSADRFPTQVTPQNS